MSSLINIPITFSGTAKFKDGTPATGSKVFLAYPTRKRVLSGSNGAAIVDAEGKWSFTIPGYAMPSTKTIVYAISSEDGSTWREFVKKGAKYDVDFKSKGGVVDLDEAVITAKKPSAKEEKSWWDKNKLWVYIGGGFCIVAITTAVIVYKSKKKKGKK